ncbi:werner syndrome-like exonuclease-like [Trifolium medium]|uniref:Werner syndrome-like exonuclease-like n=1 Tax=Trifolium medium TaxID=97028 RepID=A0A392PG43_9FABA|nr:werner syndrome-like exonuclease-like [Trifolium medium]
MGNWETPFLSKEQLEYAATDAFASWFLYQIINLHNEIEFSPLSFTLPYLPHLHPTPSTIAAAHHLPPSPLLITFHHHHRTLTTISTASQRPSSLPSSISVIFN